MLFGFCLLLPAPTPGPSLAAPPFPARLGPVGVTICMLQGLQQGVAAQAAAATSHQQQLELLQQWALVR